MPFREDIDDRVWTFLKDHGQGLLSFRKFAKHVRKIENTNKPTCVSMRYDTYFCALTAVMATKSGSPVTIPMLHLTNAQMRVKMRILVFRFSFVSMELVWQALIK
jgi:hypothetical protein